MQLIKTLASRNLVPFGYVWDLYATWIVLETFVALQRIQFWGPLCHSKEFSFGNFCATSKNSILGTFVPFQRILWSGKKVSKLSKRDQGYFILGKPFISALDLKEEKRIVAPCNSILTFLSGFFPMGMPPGHRACQLWQLCLEEQLSQLAGTVSLLTSFQVVHYAFCLSLTYYFMMSTSASLV